MRHTDANSRLAFGDRGPTQQRTSMIVGRGSWVADEAFRSVAEHLHWIPADAGDPILPAMLVCAEVGG